MIEKDITLMSIDSVYGQNTINSIYWCIKNMEKIGFKFAEVKFLTSIPQYLNKFKKKEFQKNGINIIEINKLNNINSYSKFCVTELHKHFNTNHVLLCQYDGFIIKPGLWDDCFLDYDYIGACWPDQIVGNGGFSLRSKKICNFIAKQKITQFHPEDVVYCRTYKNIAEKMGLKFAPSSIAKKFAYEYKKENSFGFHSKKELSEHKKNMISQFGELKLSAKIKFV